MGYSHSKTSQHFCFLKLVYSILHISTILAFTVDAKITSVSVATTLERNYGNGNIHQGHYKMVGATNQESEFLYKNGIHDEYHSLKSTEFNSSLPIIYITRGFLGDSITVAHVREVNPIGIPAHIVLSQWKVMIGPKNGPVISSCEPNHTRFKPTLCTKEECPWFVREEYATGIDGLHEEIEDFFTYIRPTPEELSVKHEIFERVKKFVKNIWPTSHVELFGSIRTGLFFPTSDLDVVTFGDWETPPLKFLADAAVEANLTEPNNVKIIATASVPIVRIIDKLSGIGVDFSFNNRAFQRAELVNIFSQLYPELPKILFILKKLLVNLSLNAASKQGGMSSFQLIEIIINFFQTHYSFNGRTFPHLGRLLVTFCDFFSQEYKFEASFVQVMDCGIYVPKPEDYRNGFATILQREDDCLNPVSSIGSGKSRGSSILSAIELTLQILQEKLVANAHEYRQSILASIFRISRDDLDFDRNRPECHWKKNKLNS